jgi:hypothetical protein
VIFVLLVTKIAIGFTTSAVLKSLLGQSVCSRRQKQALTCKMRTPLNVSVSRLINLTGVELK